MADYETRIDIAPESRKAVVDLLNARLADLIDLHSQAKHAHWNVKGPDFIQLHELFDELADGLREQIDEVAERLTTLGGTASGTVRMVSRASSIPDYPANAETGEAHVTALAERYAKATAGLRAAADEAEDLGDMVTNGILLDVTEVTDKGLWFLEAHLQA